MKTIDRKLSEARAMHLQICALFIFFVFSMGCEKKPELVERKKESKIKSIPARLTVANELFDFQLFQEAIEEYKKILEINPNSKPALSNIANAYLKLKTPKPAIQNLKKLLAISLNEKDHISIYYNIGAASHGLNNKTDSIVYTKRALELAQKYGRNQISKYANNNLSIFKEFYKLTDSEVSKMMDKNNKI